MNKVNDVKVTTYTHILDYKHGQLMVIEIVEKSDSFEAWIRNNDYGIANLMFGCPMKQSNGHDVDYDGFVEMVEANVEEYALMYMAEYGEE